MEQVPFAYKLYKREDKDGISLAAGFKQTFSRDVRIEFLGVWCVSIPTPLITIDWGMDDRDTVASVGVVLSRSLPLTYSNKAIKKCRHAVSLDEVSIFRVPLITMFSHALSASS